MMLSSFLKGLREVLAKLPSNSPPPMTPAQIARLEEFAKKQRKGGLKGFTHAELEEVTELLLHSCRALGLKIPR